MILAEAVYREVTGLQDTDSFSFYLAVVVVVVFGAYIISNWWKR